MDSGPSELAPVDFDVLSEIRVTADGPGGLDTYALFWDGFGQGSVEAPDLYSNNHPAGRHIVELVGGPTGHFFRFAMHRDLDRDRDRYPDVDDRQRNEAKTFAGSPEAGKGRPGETVRYHWYFRIPASYATGRRFNHVMQVKAAGGNDGSPPLTISAARRGGEAQLQVRYMSETGEIDYLSEAPLHVAFGKWLEADVIVTNARAGYVRITIREVDGPLVLTVERSDLEILRSDSDFIRPKWGIYRSTLDGGSLVNELDTLDLAEFIVQKIRLR